MNPEAIFVQTTTACNAKCVLCPHSFTYATRKTANMMDRTWNTLIAQVSDRGYTGQIGLYLHCEPLLDPKLGKRLVDIANAGAWAQISTNGLALTFNITEQIIESGCRSVVFNFMAGDKDAYGAAMGIPWEETAEKVEAFIEFAQGTETAVSINACHRAGDPDFTDALRRRFPGVSINAFTAVSRGGLLEGVAADPKNTQFTRRREGCFQPKQNFCIRADGTTLWCCMDWTGQNKGDNITKRNLFEIYEEDHLAFQRELDAGDYSRFTMCHHCSREMGWAA